MTFPPNIWNICLSSTQDVHVQYICTSKTRSTFVHGRRRVTGPTSVWVCGRTLKARRHPDPERVDGELKKTVLPTETTRLVPLRARRSTRLSVVEEVPGNWSGRKGK